MLWTGNIDEVHDVEAIVRGVAGGMGVMLWDYPLGVPSNDLRILYDGSAVPKGEKVDPKPTSILLNNLNGSLASLVQDELCPADADSLRQHARHRLERRRRVHSHRARTARADDTSTAIEESVAQAKSSSSQASCAGCHGGPSFTLVARVLHAGAREQRRSSLLLPPPPSSLLRRCSGSSAR